MSLDDEQIELDFGQPVYAGDGTRLGTVRGFDDQGFYVTAPETVELLDEESGGVYAEALMWRCWACGEMGQLGDIPEECPDCGAPKEDIYHWKED